MKAGRFAHRGFGLAQRRRLQPGRAEYGGSDCKSQCFLYDRMNLKKDQAEGVG
jgi:hypothetical protein